MIQKSYQKLLKFTKIQQKNSHQIFNSNFTKVLTENINYNFARNTKINVKSNFENKLFKKQLEKEEKQIQNKEINSQKTVKQTYNDDVDDFRDIELSQEDDKLNKQLQPKEEEYEQQLSKDQIKFIRDTLLYKGDDPYPEKLVHRPEKGVVWGLGGELIRKKKNFFTKGEWPTHEEIMGFLELEQAKEIDCIDTELELGRTDLPKYIICASSFSCVHNYRIAKNLLIALKELEIQDYPRRLMIDGRQDDEWVMVDFNDTAVHIFTEESREEIGFEDRLRNPPNDDDVDEYLKIAQTKRKQSVFEPLKDI